MTRICVIGGGPSGLALLRAFENIRREGVDIPDLVCYEKQNNVGGLWNYTWRTGLDEYGEPVHSSMYRYLWSNAPKECLEFADYSFEEHFGRPIPSFPPRAILLDYLRGRIQKSGVLDKVRLNSVVRWVEYSDQTGRFTVSIKDLKKDETSSEEFDYVAVATGHFATPNVPFFEGIDKFPGRVVHSHDFRGADEFVGKNLLVIGGSYSAEDIGLQCYKYGAKSVTFSYRTQPMAFKWPATVEEVPLLTRLDGKVAHFKDGSSREVDAVILCTGYLHNFPFLPDGMRLKTNNSLYPLGLYKGIFWEKNTKLIYIGMQNQFFTFNMFDAQACYARDVILGRIEMSTAAGIVTDIQSWRAREQQLKTPFEMIDFQADYIRDLIATTNYAHFDVDGVVKRFKEWENDKMANIITNYRDKSYSSTLTGTMAPTHHTTWMEALDDTMTTFLKTEKDGSV